MSDLIPAFNTVKFLWNESKVVRQWLWSKTPFAKDAIKRELAEKHLATLLEDANKLNRSLSPDEADAAIDRRIEQFRLDLIKDKISEEDANTLVERGGLFVKLLITGPMGETVLLKERMGTSEIVIQEVERAIERMRVDNASKESVIRLEERLKHLETQLNHTRIFAVVSLVLAAIAVALAKLAGH